MWRTFNSITEMSLRPWRSSTNMSYTNIRLHTYLPSVIHYCCCLRINTVKMLQWVLIWSVLWRIFANFHTIYLILLPSVWNSHFNARVQSRFLWFSSVDNKYNISYLSHVEPLHLSCEISQLLWDGSTSFLCTMCTIVPPCDWHLCLWDIHFPLKMNCNHFADSFCFVTKHLQN